MARTIRSETGPGSIGKWLNSRYYKGFLGPATDYGEKKKLYCLQMHDQCIDAYAVYSYRIKTCLNR